MLIGIGHSSVPCNCEASKKLVEHVTFECLRNLAPCMHGERYSADVLQTFHSIIIFDEAVFCIVWEKNKDIW